MLSCFDIAHGLSVKGRHISFAVFIAVFIELFEVRQLYRIEKRAEKHAGIASVASVFIYHGLFFLAFTFRPVFHLYANILTAYHACATAVTIFYSIC